MKKIFQSIIVLVFIFNGCCNLRLPEKYLLENIKVGEEEKYTFKQITNDSDHLNATIKYTSMTFYSLLDKYLIFRMMGKNLYSRQCSEIRHGIQCIGLEIIYMKEKYVIRKILNR